MRLIASHVVPTAGEFAPLVLSRPCTIHGWRPISVSIQPNAHATKGKKVVTTATQRNHFNRSSRRFHIRNAPISATSATNEPA